MELVQLRESVKGVLSDSRYHHSLGVEDVCYDLALIHQEDTLKASIAGILHDCAKYMTDEEFLKEFECRHLQIAEIERKLPYLLHARLSAIHAKEKYGVTDQDIINAITYHTTGRPAMSKLEKIVYVADYIEPYRKPVPMLDEIRERTYKDIDEALIMVLDRTITYLNEKDAIVCGSTVETYNYYVNLNKIENTKM